MRYSLFACLVLGTLMMVPPTTVYSQDKQAAQATAKSQTVVKVELDKPGWQSVLDRLFGTPESGLLDGTAAFNFRAEDLRLTSDQSAAFFTSTSSAADLADLIAGATALKGQVRMEGTIDGTPFELKLAGRELKIEGIAMTSIQRDALMAELKGISGLHEAKIEGLVDGRANTIHLAGGKERISLGRDPLDVGRRDGKDKTLDGISGTARGAGRVDLPGVVDVDSRARGAGRIELPEVTLPGRGR
jgi:hypothetical protein